MTPPVPRATPLGDRAILLVFGDRIDAATHRRVTAATAAIRRAAPAGLEEVVPAYATLAAWFDPAVRRYRDLAGELQHLAGSAAATTAAAGRAWRIPVRYDGPDLAWVAERTGLSPADVVARHSAGEYTVFLLGFVPGFAYLGALDPSLALPRRPSPRRRVPAGSVAIAGAQTAVYPLETPGGWHLIGRTDLVLFDPERDPAALLAPGDTVRFDPIP